MEIGQAVEKGIVSNLTDAVMGTKTLAEAAVNVLNDLKRKLIELAIQRTVSGIGNFIGNALSGVLGGGFKSLGKDLVDGLFEGVSNPIGGLFVGVLATVLVESSSVSTSVIVGLVAAGVVNTGDAVPMIMGANLGTTVTNTLASLGHVRHDIEFKRAFAAATVHDFFNILAVIVFLPIELITGYLSSSASWLTDTLICS